MNQREARVMALDWTLADITDDYLAADAAYRHDGYYSDADIGRIERAFEQIADMLDGKLKRAESTIAKAQGDDGGKG